MSDNEIGSVGWMDMSTEDAVGVSRFYSEVVGFQLAPTDMGGYEDFTLVAPGTRSPVAGVCHARGPNEDFPGGWLPYFIVTDLDRSLQKCHELGGKTLIESRSYGDGRYCVVQDPGGTATALYQA
ncbi:MAG: VOC family protein [Woeseiaceae bacterium]|nr:VOC family protein [Woeseiaceae bacterium]